MSNVFAYLSELDTFPLQILNIHHLGYPHDDTKLRVQIRPHNIIELRDKKLIVGKYSNGSDLIYAIFDPFHASSLSFKNNSSLNISIDDVNIAQEVGIILKRDKNQSIILLLKNQLVLDFSEYFYLNSSDHDVNQWRQLLIDWYSTVTSTTKYLNFKHFASYKATSDNYTALRHLNSVNFIHISNFSFKKGFKKNFSIIVDEILYRFLTYDQHFRIIMNNVNLDSQLVSEIRQILKEQQNPLFKINHNEIILEYNLKDYLDLVSNFTSNQLLSCATPSNINNFISTRYSSISLNFQDVRTQRFKERLLAGKSSDWESFYFDSWDARVRDLIYHSKSYSDFLLERLMNVENIYDLFLSVYEIDEHVECLRFWNAFKRAMITVNIDYHYGGFSTILLKDQSKEFMVKKIVEFLQEKSNQYFTVKKRDMVTYKLEKHYSYRYLQKFFKSFQNPEVVHFDLQISYVDNELFAGYAFLGKTSGVGIFPLIFPEVFFDLSDNYFFCVGENNYYVKSSRDAVNFYSI